MDNARRASQGCSPSSARVEVFRLIKGGHAPSLTNRCDLNLLLPNCPQVKRKRSSSKQLPSQLMALPNRVTATLPVVSSGKEALFTELYSLQAVNGW
jgi:hypothetical protein